MAGGSPRKAKTIRRANILLLAVEGGPDAMMEAVHAVIQTVWDTRIWMSLYTRLPVLVWLANSRRNKRRSS
jgi:hypothetical protein